VTLRAVRLNAVAALDIDRTIDGYRSDAGAAVARRFVASLQQSLLLLAEYPETGSLRYAQSLNIKDLRTLQIKGFPWMLFYIVQTEVTVIRMLHSHSDIPSWLADENR
jgi:toxin ParE1/3/4